MQRSQNQKPKKTNLVGGRMMPKQEGFWWTQRPLGTSNLRKDNSEEDVRNLKEAI